MNTFPFQEMVAIDTNVFIHILNDQNNQDKHINTLLGRLYEKRVSLLLDENGRIMGEYKDLITPLIEGSNERQSESSILRYWIHIAPKEYSEVKQNDELMSAIKKIIHEREEVVDQIFVYIALRKRKTLITNDDLHILSGPTNESNESPRSTRLLRKTRRHRVRGGAILNSQEAFDKIQDYEKTQQTPLP